MSSVLSRIRGSLLGGACGDALGYPVEHKTIEAIRELYGETGLKEMETRDGVAMVTDDTQMTIYTAQGLICAGKKHCDYEDTVREVHKSYLRWIASLLPTEDVPSRYEHVYSREELTRNELLENGANPGLNKKMCRGGSTFRALLSGRMYSVNDPADEGVRCGTTMRSAPIAVHCYKNPSLAFRLGRDCAALTHGHASAYLAAGVMCMVIARLIDGSEMKDAIDESLAYLKTQEDGEKLYDVLMKGVELSRHPSEKPLDDIQTIGLGWRADENLAITFYCCLRFGRDVKSALLACVNHDGDSDSVAAVCGNIMGAYVGEEGLPPDFVSSVQFRELICEQANSLYSCAVSSLPSSS